MLSIFFAICIAGMARHEKRPPIIWGFLTFTLSITFQLLGLSGYWGAVLGLIAAFALMTYANIKHPVKKGVVYDVPDAPLAPPEQKPPQPK